MHESDTLPYDIVVDLSEDVATEMCNVQHNRRKQLYLTFSTASDQSDDNIMKHLSAMPGVICFDKSNPRTDLVYVNLANIDAEKEKLQSGGDAFLNSLMRPSDSSHQILPDHVAATGILCNLICELCLHKHSPYSKKDRFTMCVICGRVKCLDCAGDMDGRISSSSSLRDIQDMPTMWGSGSMVACICPRCPCPPHPNDRKSSTALQCAACDSEMCPNNSTSDKRVPTVLLSELHALPRNCDYADVRNPMAPLEVFTAHRACDSTIRTDRMVDWLWYELPSLFTFVTSTKMKKPTTKKRKRSTKRRRSKVGAHQVPKEGVGSAATHPEDLRITVLHAVAENLMTQLEASAIQGCSTNMATAAATLTTMPTSTSTAMATATAVDVTHLECNAQLECRFCGKAMHIACLPTPLCEGGNGMKKFAQILIGGDYMCSACVLRPSKVSDDDLRREVQLVSLTSVGLWLEAFGLTMVVTMGSSSAVPRVKGLRKAQSGAGAGRKCYVDVSIYTLEAKLLYTTDTGNASHWLCEGHPMTSPLITIDRFEEVLEEDGGRLRKLLEERTTNPRAVYMLQMLEDCNAYSMGMVVDAVQKERERSAGNTMTYSRMKWHLFFLLNDNMMVSGVVGKGALTQYTHRALDGDVVDGIPRISSFFFRSHDDVFQGCVALPPSYTSRPNISILHTFDTSLGPDALSDLRMTAAFGLAAKMFVDPFPVDMNVAMARHADCQMAERMDRQMAERMDRQMAEHLSDADVPLNVANTSVELAYSETDTVVECDFDDEDLNGPHDDIMALVGCMEHLRCGSMQWAVSFDATRGRYAPMCRMEFAIDSLTELFRVGYGGFGSELVLGGQFFVGSCRTFLSDSECTEITLDTVAITRSTSMLHKLNDVICDGLAGLAVNLCVIRFGDIDGLGGRRRDNLVSAVIKRPPSYLLMDGLFVQEDAAVTRAVMAHRYRCDRFMVTGGCDWQTLSLMNKVFDGRPSAKLGVWAANSGQLADTCRYPVTMHTNLQNSAAGRACTLPMAVIFSAMAGPLDMDDMHAYAKRCLAGWTSSQQVVAARTSHAAGPPSDCNNFYHFSDVAYHWLDSQFAHAAVIASSRKFGDDTRGEIGTFGYNTYVGMTSGEFGGPLVDTQVVFLVVPTMYMGAVAVGVTTFRRCGGSTYSRVETGRARLDPGGLASQRIVDKRAMRDAIEATHLRGGCVMHVETKVLAPRFEITRATPTPMEPRLRLDF
jgi:hypothetical protein